MLSRLAAPTINEAITRGIARKLKSFIKRVPIGLKYVAKVSFFFIDSIVSKISALFC